MVQQTQMVVPRLIKLGLIGLIIAHMASVMVLAWVPPVSRDALTHHLYVPKLYLNHGGMYEIPSIKFSYYPMNLDLLFTVPLYFGNDILPKYVHYAFGLLTAWLIFRYLRRRIDAVHGLLGALLFISIPVVCKLSITAYVDLGLVFFSTAAIMVLLRWTERGFQNRYLLTSAVFCGLALGTKYNGLITLFLLTLFIPVLFIRKAKASTAANIDPDSSSAICHRSMPKRAQIKSLLAASIFVLVSLGIFSPWMIRNYVWTGNPIYPMYHSVFASLDDVRNAAGTHHDMSAIADGPGEQTTEEVRTKRKRVGHFTIRKRIYQETWWETALIPVRIFFQGRDNDPKYFDGRLTPILLIFPFFAFILRRSDSNAVATEKYVWLAFAVLYLSYAFVTRDMRIRYIAPIIPPLVILSMFGFHRLGELGRSARHKFIGKLIKVSVTVALICFLGFNFKYLMDQFRIVEPMRFISGQVDRHAYIEKHRPEYAAIQYANRHTPENAKILAVFLGNRGYYFDRSVDFNFGFLKTTLHSADSVADIIGAIKSRQLTHLLIRFDLFATWVKRNLTQKETVMLQECLDHYTQKMFISAGHGLYRVN